MFRPRRAATVLVATLATASIALPAWAHASFDRSQVPAEAEVDLTFRAPQERASTNERIEALAPKEWTVLECTAPLNWTCSIDETSQAPRTVLTWEAQGATSVPESNFAFHVRTPGEDEQGVYAWPVIQTYADGHEAAWIGDTAPTIQVGDSDAQVVENDGEGTSHEGSSPKPAPSSSSAPSSAAPGDDASEATAPAPSDGADGEVAPAPLAQATAPQDEGRPTGIIVAVIGLAVVGGAAFVLRGRLG